MSTFSANSGVVPYQYRLEPDTPITVFQPQLAFANIGSTAFNVATPGVVQGFNVYPGGTNLTGVITFDFGVAYPSIIAHGTYSITFNLNADCGTANLNQSRIELSAWDGGARLAQSGDIHTFPTNGSIIIHNASIVFSTSGYNLPIEVRPRLYVDRNITTNSASMNQLTVLRLKDT